MYNLFIDRKDKKYGWIYVTIKERRKEGKKRKECEKKEAEGKRTEKISNEIIAVDRTRFPGGYFSLKTVNDITRQSRLMTSR